MWIPDPSSGDSQWELLCRPQIRCGTHRTTHLLVHTPQRRHDAGKPGFPQDPHYLLQLQPVPYHEIEPGCQRRRRGHSMPGRRRCRDPGHMALASPRAPSRYHHATGGRTRSPGEPGAGEPGARRRPSPKAARHEDAGNQADVRGEGRRKGASYQDGRALPGAGRVPTDTLAWTRTGGVRLESMWIAPSVVPTRGTCGAGLSSGLRPTAQGGTL